MLTIYTKPGCHPCRLTIKTANKLGLNYQEKPAKEPVSYTHLTLPTNREV